jgi:pimeloyl-[acyl-carrier protein] methyl ester esterase
MINRKPNLVLIHGWGFNSTIWQTNLEYLQSKFNIITIDLNGHGLSKYNHNYHNLDLYLENIIPMIPDNSNILGWSLGGIIALKLKNKYHNKVNKIILCCSTPCFINNNNWNHGVDQKTWHKFSNDLLTDCERTLQNFLLLQTINHRDAKILYKKLININNNSNPPDQNGLIWGLNILQQDHRLLLKNIDNNYIKFILGARDLLINKNLSTWLKENHPDIKTYLLNNSGHIPFITDHELFYNYLELEVL